MSPVFDCPCWQIGYRAVIRLFIINLKMDNFSNLKLSRMMLLYLLEDVLLVRNMTCGIDTPELRHTPQRK